MANKVYGEIAAAIIAAVAGEAVYEFIIHPYLARRYPIRLS
ncbi:MAG: hypothetical protein ACREBU_02565 [Nitrososphaera sp.]